jgi:hypothetical protein
MRASAALLLPALLASGATALSSAGAAAAEPPAPGRPVTVQTVHTLANVPLDVVAAVLRGFASRPEAVKADAAKRVLIVEDTVDRMPRLVRAIEAMARARPGDRVWVEPVHGAGTASRYAGLFSELGLGTGVSGRLSAIVGVDDAERLVIVGDEVACMRVLDVVRQAPASRDDGTELSILLLRHADADDIARRLRPMVETLRAKHAAGPAGAPPGLRLTADLATNCIILSASREDTATLRLAVQALDVPLRSILLEVAVAEAPASPVAGTSSLRPGQAELVTDEGRRAIWATHDPSVVDRRMLFSKETATSELRVDVRNAAPRPGGEAVRGYRIAVETQGHTSPDQVRLTVEVTACAAPDAPCAGPTSTTTMVMREDLTVVLAGPERERARPGPAPGVERASLFVVLTPHWIRNHETDLPRLFARRQLELEEARATEMLFGDPSRRAPLRIERGARGLLGVIRGAQRGSPPPG